MRYRTGLGEVFAQRNQRGVGRVDLRTIAQFSDCVVVDAGSLRHHCGTPILQQCRDLFQGQDHNFLTYFLFGC